MGFWPIGARAGPYLYFKYILMVKFVKNNLGLHCLHVVYSTVCIQALIFFALLPSRATRVSRNFAPALMPISGFSPLSKHDRPFSLLTTKNKRNASPHSPAKVGLKRLLRRCLLLLNLCLNFGNEIAVETQLFCSVYALQISERSMAPGKTKKGPIWPVPVTRQQA